MAKGKQQYHHGALRQALLDAALEILTEDGLDAMSLRAIARRAGVSQAAPYSHFKNRDEILAGVAQLGFERLSRDLRRAERGGRNTGDSLKAQGVAYIRFAAKNPDLYRLMFSSEARNSNGVEGLAETAADSYGVISGSVARQLGDTEADAGTLAAWALVHGIADLVRRGRITLPRSAAAQKKFIEEILSHLF